MEKDEFIKKRKRQKSKYALYFYSLSEAEDDDIHLVSRPPHQQRGGGQEDIVGTGEQQENRPRGLREKRDEDENGNLEQMRTLFLQRSKTTPVKATAERRPGANEADVGESSHLGNSMAVASVAVLLQPFKKTSPKKRRRLEDVRVSISHLKSNFPFVLKLVERRPTKQPEKIREKPAIKQSGFTEKKQVRPTLWE
jgi:hypothetical protein